MFEDLLGAACVGPFLIFEAADERLGVTDRIKPLICGFIVINLSSCNHHQEFQKTDAQIQHQ